MKLTHLYAVCACALLSLGAVNADNAYAQKAQAKKEAAAAHKNAPVPVDRIAAVVNHDVITENSAAAENSSSRNESSQKKHCPASDGKPSRPDARSYDS